MIEPLILDDNFENVVHLIVMSIFMSYNFYLFKEIFFMKSYTAIF